MSLTPRIDAIEAKINELINSVKNPLIIEERNVSIHNAPLVKNVWQIPTVNWWIELPEDGDYILEYSTGTSGIASSGQIQFQLALATSLTPGQGLIDGTGSMFSEPDAKNNTKTCKGRTKPLPFYSRN
jgi:hypothetical protein